MSVDRTRVLEAAQKHLSKGNYDKAIGELRKIVESDPSDIRTWLKIGDLYTRKGARKEAIDTYLKVAQRYADQGFFLKAVAVYKQILKLDPTRLDVQEKLAEMYELLQLVSDAMSTYEQVAAGYARAGSIDRALDTLRKMTALDPENIPIRIKCAEALSKAGRTKQAAEEFEAGAKLLKAQGRLDDFLKVAERLLYHRPEDVSVARELAAMYLQRNDPKRALSKLQLCFKADPKDIPTLELLAEAFNQLGQLPKTISVYKEVARIHQEAKRDGERLRVLRRVLELDPGDQEARKAVAANAAAAGSAVRADIQPPASAVVEPGRAPPPPSGEVSAEEIEEVEDVEVLEVDDEEDLIIVEEPVTEEAAEVAEAPEAAEAAPSGARSVPPDVQREADVARLMTECDVFMRYGLKQKVIDQLHRVLEIDPMHVEARERLKEMHLDEGRVEEAVGELFALADIFAEEQSAAAALYLRQVLELDPGHAEAHRRLAEMGASIPPGAMPAAEAELAPPSGEVTAEEEDEVFFVEDEADLTSIESADEVEGMEPGLPTPVEPAQLLPDDEIAAEAAALPPLEEAAPSAPKTDQHELPPEPEVEAPPPRQAIMPPAASGEPVTARGAGLQDPLAPMTPEEFDEVPLRPSAPDAVQMETSQRLSMPPGEVEEMLDEADFFIAQGLFDEAHGTLSEALNSHPEHPLIKEKLREVGQFLQAPAQPAPAQPAAAQHASAQHAAAQHASAQHASAQPASAQPAAAQPAAAQHASAQPPAAAPGAPSPASSAGPISLDMDDQSFELAEKLAEEFDEVDEGGAGSDVLDVEQVFEQFKKGVQAQVGMEDTETHFDLGIAYKEMGLIDDAINEFRLCLTNPQRLCIAQTMIGLCHVEKGELSDAISHFKKGLYADTKTEREELGLYYELGNAYELLHDPKEALYYFQKVQKRDPSFRNVEGRIEGLSRPQAPVETPPAMGQDDIDAAFDDLMGED